MFSEAGCNSSIELMEADQSSLSIHSSYNVSGISFDPQELASEIKRILPKFSITYKPDFRQAIAESWPQTIDDSVARNDWGWKSEYDLEKMTKIMLKQIKKKHL
jgi:nucleoside-diphosphate-sugar epimerase